MSIDTNDQIHQNPLIIEGLWGLGKTEIAKEFASKYNYVFLTEPLHTSEENPAELEDLDSWYSNAHFHRMRLLDRFDSPVIMERSILSTYAFLHAMGRPFLDSSNLEQFLKLSKDKKMLLVYLKGKEKYFLDYSKLSEYSKDIQYILTTYEAKQRYEEWYLDILPNKFGMVPYILDVNGQDSRRHVGELVQEIRACITHQRVAQVNIVAYRVSCNNQVNIDVLVLKRSKERGGFWQTITGGVRPGEFILNAAKREISEEIGIRLDDDDLLYTGFSYSFIGSDGYRLREYVLGCRISDEAMVRISEEHDNFKWVNWREAKKYMKFLENQQAIDLVKRKVAECGLP